MALSRKVQTLRDLNAEFGVPGDVHTAPAGWNCPVHDVELVQESTATLAGWQGLLCCPSFDGTCSFDPEGTVERVDKPADVTAAEQARDQAQQQAQLDDVVVINVTRDTGSN